MLSQMLVTLAVIVLAWLFLRRRKRLQTSKPGENAKQRSDADVGRFLAKARENPWQNAARGGADLPHPTSRGSRQSLLLWLTLTLAISLGLAFSAWHWWDQGREVTVLLYQGEQAAPVVYRVPKRNLGERSFTTADGIQVRVSTSERMEVIGL